MCARVVGGELLNGRTRALVGTLTTCVALGIGVLLWSDGRVWAGGFLCALGVYRGVQVVRRLRD
jgi:hypothetical protein